VPGEERDDRGNQMAHHPTIRATPSALRASASLLLLVAVLAATADPAAATGTRCLAAPIARCLSIRVPLDRSGTLPGTIRIHAARVRSRRSTRPPLIALTGGPGQAGVIFASTYDRMLPTAGRDLVVLDQRGTGASGLLRCPSLEGRNPLSSARAAGACGRRLGAQRSFYTSADSADDLEALRIRLGVSRIALYAVSYGTRVAVEYARRHPQRVERMILDSPVGIDAPDSLARETLGAVGRVLRDACRHGCGAAGAHPVADMARLVAVLRRSPIRRVVRRGGRRVPVSVGVDDLLGTLVSGDLDPAFMRRVPPAVRAALAGDGGPLVRLKLDALASGEDDLVSEFDPAVFVAATCEESTLAWDPAGAPPARRLQARAVLDATPSAALAPFDRAAALDFGLLPVCGSWPARERAVAPAPPLPTDVPTLVLSGDLDLRTPLENARRLATALHGRLVIERDVGHAVLGADPNGCAPPAVEAFLARRPPPACRREAVITLRGRGTPARPALRAQPGRHPISMPG
jgi:pimeloyl-ACP methyl ester carboxylesterase